MAQCKAATAAGTQCVSEAVAPSRSLCKRHQTVLASGKPVVNFETGRKFPAPAAAAPVKAASARARATSAVRSAAPARVPRAARAAVGAVDDNEPRESRALGEHSLMCEGPRCGNMSLPGSNYCMAHQRLA